MDYGNMAHHSCYNWYRVWSRIETTERIDQTRRCISAQTPEVFNQRVFKPIVPATRAGHKPTRPLQQPERQPPLRLEPSGLVL